MNQPNDLKQMQEMIHSMDQQIICFTDEKLELEKQVEELKAEVEHLKKSLMAK